MEGFKKCVGCWAIVGILFVTAGCQNAPLRDGDHGHQHDRSEAHEHHASEKNSEATPSKIKPPGISREELVIESTLYGVGR